MRRGAARRTGGTARTIQAAARAPQQRHPPTTARHPRAALPKAPKLLPSLHVRQAMMHMPNHAQAVGLCRQPFKHERTAMTRIPHPSAEQANAALTPDAATIGWGAMPRTIDHQEQASTMPMHTFSLLFPAGPAAATGQRCPCHEQRRRTPRTRDDGTAARPGMSRADPRRPGSTRPLISQPRLSSVTALPTWRAAGMDRCSCTGGAFRQKAMPPFRGKDAYLRHPRTGQTRATNRAHVARYGVTRRPAHAGHPALPAHGTRGAPHHPSRFLTRRMDPAVTSHRRRIQSWHSQLTPT